MYELLDTIRLKDHEIQRASGAKDYLVNILTSRAQNGLLPTPQDTFLTGSYRRGTKIAPLDDVDIFYVIGRATKINNDWHTLADCDYSFGSEFYDLDNNISSVKVLELIKRAIEPTYPNSEVRRNGEVVRLHLESYGLGMDIAPAFEIQNSDYFLIPNGSGSTKWKKTNPKTDERLVNTLEHIHNEMFKDVIKITKYWFKRKRIVSPRSYHLESATYHMFSGLNAPITSHSEGLSVILGNLNLYLRSCSDPTGLSGNISSDLTEADIINILTEADEALRQLSYGEEKFIEYVEGQ